MTGERMKLSGSSEIDLFLCLPTTSFRVSTVSGLDAINDRNNQTERLQSSFTCADYSSSPSFKVDATETVLQLNPPVELPTSNRDW